jgi:hypothetical protein
LADQFAELELLKFIRNAPQPVWPAGSKDAAGNDISGKDKNGTSAQLSLSSEVGETYVAQWSLTIVMDVFKK